MSVNSSIASLLNSRNTIRDKMVAAGQASSTDKLADLSDNLVIGTDTSDANATAGDIVSGKTAYINGVKVTGTMAMSNSEEIEEIVNDIFKS